MEPAGLTADGPARGIYQGFRIFELARTDASLATWYTAQAGLFRTAIRVGASAEQQAEWMPRVIDFSLKGVFSLTEPGSGSDIAGGLSTTARRQADGSWVLDGAKRWIGGAATADVLAVFARDAADGQVKAFLVDRAADGITLEKIQGDQELTRVPVVVFTASENPHDKANFARRGVEMITKPHDYQDFQQLVQGFFIFVYCHNF